MNTKLGRTFLKNSDTCIKELIFKEQILQMLVQERLKVFIYRKHQAKLENCLKEVQRYLVSCDRGQAMSIRGPP